MLRSHLKSPSFLCRNPAERSSETPEANKDNDDELEEKISRIQEMFPQLSRTQLLDVSLRHKPHLYNFC